MGDNNGVEEFAAFVVIACLGIFVFMLPFWIIWGFPKPFTEDEFKA